MSKTTRLPVQHKKKPHCPSCGIDLPTFESAVMMDAEESECELLKVIFLIRCSCGSVWNIEKTVKS